MSESIVERNELSPPKQRRSRDALRRILGAARTLLATRDHEEVTLRGIAEEADVSQSSLFARFRTKEALLDHVHEELCQERRRRAEQLLERSDASHAGIADMTEDLMRAFITHLRDEGSLVRSLTRAGNRIDSIRKREAELRRWIAEQARDAVLRRLPPHLCDSAQTMVESQIAMIMAAAPQLLHESQATLLADGVSDEELAARLTQVALRAAAPPGPSDQASGGLRKPEKAQASR